MQKQVSCSLPRHRKHRCHRRAPTPTGQKEPTRVRCTTKTWAMFTPKRIKPSLAPEWEVENKGKHGQFHFPGTAEPTVCTSGCLAAEPILLPPRSLGTCKPAPPVPPRVRLRLIPRRRHPWAPGTGGCRGNQRCSPERRRGLRAPRGAAAGTGAGARYLGVLLGQLLVLPLQLRRGRRHLRSAGLGWTRLGRARLDSGAPAGPARPRMGRRTSGFRAAGTR